MEDDSRLMFYGAEPEIFRKAAMLRRNMTESEKILWGHLRHGINGYKFRRQHPIDIFIVDFYCHKKRLVIEVDGKKHKIKNVTNRDQARTEELEVFGIRVIRFTNKQVEENINDVISVIKSYL